MKKRSLSAGKTIDLWMVQMEMLGVLAVIPQQAEGDAGRDMVVGGVFACSLSHYSKHSVP